MKKCNHAKNICTSTYMNIICTYEHCLRIMDKQATCKINTRDISLFYMMWTLALNRYVRLNVVFLIFRGKFCYKQNLWGGPAQTTRLSPFLPMSLFSCCICNMHDNWGNDLSLLMFFHNQSCHTGTSIHNYIKIEQPKFISTHQGQRCSALINMHTV